MLSRVGAPPQATCFNECERYSNSSRSRNAYGMLPHALSGSRRVCTNVPSAYVCGWPVKTKRGRMQLEQSMT